MDLNALYNIAEKEKIKIYNWKIEDVNGMYLEYKNNRLGDRAIPYRRPQARGYL